MATGSLCRVSASVAHLKNENIASSIAAATNSTTSATTATAHVPRPKRLKRGGGGGGDSGGDGISGGESVHVVLARHHVSFTVNPAQAGALETYAGSEIPVVVDLQVLYGEDVDMDAEIGTGSARTGRLILSSPSNGGELMALNVDLSTLPDTLPRDITRASTITTCFPAARSPTRPFSSSCSLAFTPATITLTLTLTARCHNAPTPSTTALASTDPWWCLLADAFPAHAPVVKGALRATPKDFYAACHVPARTQVVPDSVQHPVLECTLLPYQRRTVQWMLNREGAAAATIPEDSGVLLPPTFFRERDAEGAECYVSHVFGLVSRDLQALWRAAELPRGGLLAEEMGLGKTVEMIALMALHAMPAAMAAADRRNIGVTLIITPPSILEQWKSEIAAHAPSVRVCHYRGMKQHLRASTAEVVELFRAADVVLTTYAVLSHELHYLTAKDWTGRLSRAKRYEARRSPLGELTWWRVCVDEAQMIDGGLSNAAVVARQIPRVNAWAVSGTPIRKDSVSDVHGLLRFLRYAPLDDRSPGPFEALARYNRAAFGAVVGTIALRHTKNMVNDEIRLPLQKRVVVRVPFSAIEEQNYRHLFQQMCDECRISEERAAAGGDGVLPEVVEKLRVWLTRLRQTCLHPQAGERNRRTFGGTKAPLRTVDEVLDLMADAHSVAVRNDERALFESKIRRGQLLEMQKEYSAALQVWMGVLVEVREVVGECRAALEAEPKTRLLHEAAAVDEPVEWYDEEGEGEAAGHGHDARADTSRHGTLRNRLRNVLELEHACLFWIGTAWFQLKEQKEEADPQSEEIAQLREKEEENYEAAKLVRREMMHETRSRALKLIDTLRARANTHRFTAIPPIPACNTNCGIETQTLLYDITDIAATLNAQADLITEWRAQLLELLAKPILDEDTTTTTAANNADDQDQNRGNEFEVSVSDQELGERLMTGIRVLLADRAEALSGEESSSLIRHEVQADLARAGLHQAFFAEMMVRREGVGLPAQVACRSLKAGVAGLRQKVAGFKGVGASAGARRLAMQRELVEEEIAVLAEVVGVQIEVNRKLTNEITLFRNLTNARREYYSQMQAISDTVAPFEPEVFFSRSVRIDDALFQKLLNEERALAEKITKAKSKLRYLVHLKGKGVEEAQECLICKETYEIGILTSCGHSYCKECMVEWYKTSRKCPACTAALSLKDMYQISYRPKEATMQEERAQASSSSDPAAVSIYSGMDKRIMDEIKRVEIRQHFGSKIDMIIRHLLWLRQHEPGFKAVLFSQWGDFLDFMKTVLTHSHIGFATLDGRGGGAGVHAFRTDPATHCFLLHAKSQSAGLSLVGATHVFLCEPLLNVSLELQAISRVHRIGQKRPTTVWLYVVEGSVEENVWALATGRRIALMEACGEREKEGEGGSGGGVGDSAGVESLRLESPEGRQGEVDEEGEGERWLDVANSMELQKGVGGLVERGVGGGEVVGVRDVWECLFGARSGRGHGKVVEDVVRREMLAGAAERRMRGGD
ncbi:SNF2 family N-terminal domain-containing protein [Morchella snyderi]|nr:SNF2 family N-terminal domain-containing protein [Morchella snyderi]